MRLRDSRRAELAVDYALKKSVSTLDISAGQRMNLEYQALLMSSNARKIKLPSQTLKPPTSILF